MDRFVYFCRWAGSGDPAGAARALLTEASEAAVEQLLQAALWRDTDVADFEHRGLRVLIEPAGAFGGRFWLAAEAAPRVLLPPAPRVSPREVVALARGLVGVLAN